MFHALKNKPKGGIFNPHFVKSVEECHEKAKDVPRYTFCFVTDGEEAGALFKCFPSGRRALYQKLKDGEYCEV